MLKYILIFRRYDCLQLLAAGYAQNFTGYREHPARCKGIAQVMHPTVPENLNEVNIMKSVNRIYVNTVNIIRNCHRWPNRGMQSRVTILALCSALLLPGIAMAKKPEASSSSAGCSVLPSVVYTGHPFTVKVVRDPAYTGVWSQPTVDVTAVFTKTDGGTITKTSSETISKYGVTYVNTTISAPSCNGDPCEIDYLSENALVLTATVKEPINKGKQTRETVCAPASAMVNMAN